VDIVFVGINLAKNVFAVHGVNESGKPELVRPSVLRARTLADAGVGRWGQIPS
jgi:transposase